MALLPVNEAKDEIIKGIDPIDCELVPLKEAAGRVLACDIVSRRTHPPFPASAMDGYAVRVADLETIPTKLKVIGEAPAGHPFQGKVEVGQAVRIFTGGEVPEGADTIVIQENTEQSDDLVTVKEATHSGAFIRPAGLDFKLGDRLLTKGTRLMARHIALAAAMNHKKLCVVEKPKIAILATGDELVEPGNELAEGQIIASNSYGLYSMLQKLGAEPVDLGIAKDNLAAITRCIKAAVDAKCQALVTLGGASVGEHDLVQQALKDSGCEMAFWRIAMRPGKPLMFGRLNGMSVLGLPGNPVSAMVCSRIFLRPLVLSMLGLPDTDNLQQAYLQNALKENDQRQDYLRGLTHTDPKNGQTLVTVFDKQDSSMLALLSKANCLVIREPFAPPASAGEPVKVLPLHDG